MIDAPTALIYTMVLVSAADSDMTDAEFQTIGAIVKQLPVFKNETAYALACDVAAADAHASQEELRMLEMLQDKLDVGALEIAAIERGARARHTVL
jgi:tellurite resistance protein